MARLDVGRTVGNVGEYLREQRTQAQLSLRQLADLAGVSNPYLSQVERGLRKPSAEVLQGLAKGLRISAETLYVRAGILDPGEDGTRSVERAVLADAALSQRQKRALLDIYAAFRAESGPSTPTTDRVTDLTAGSTETRSTQTGSTKTRTTPYRPKEDL